MKPPRADEVTPPSQELMEGGGWRERVGEGQFGESNPCPPLPGCPRAGNIRPAVITSQSAAGLQALDRQVEPSLSRSRHSGTPTKASLIALSGRLDDEM